MGAEVLSLISFLWADHRSKDQFDGRSDQSLQSSRDQLFCRSMYLSTFAMLILMGSLISRAEANRFERLSVNFTETAEVMEFSFGAEGAALSSSQIKVERDLPNRLKMIADGVRCRRAWQRGSPSPRTPVQAPSSPALVFGPSWARREARPPRRART